MNTAIEEKRQASFDSEVSINSKDIAVKVCHSNIIQRDCNDVPGTGENLDSTPQDLHSLVKLNSLIGAKTLPSTFLNHNGDDRETDDAEDILKTVGDDQNVKAGNHVESQEKEAEERPVVKPTQVILTPEQLAAMSKQELVESWNQQEHYINSLHSTLESTSHEVNDLRKVQINEERLKAQLSEIQKKEQYHIMRLATKEHENQELAAQIEELKNMAAGGNSLKHSLLDPAVNLLFERMKRDFDTTKSKMEETQNELAAWKFTPDSTTGKQLMARCRLLIKENEELGKMISSGRLSKLESDLALQRSFSDELKKSQSELEEFLQEMDEDTEGMQGTILYLQSQLRQAKEKNSHQTGQLASLGPATSNNTPASTADVPEYSECTFVEMEEPPLHNEDSLPQFASDEAPRGPLLESGGVGEYADSFGGDLPPDESPPVARTRPNGDLAANSTCKSGASDGPLKTFSNGRKRTQSVIQEGAGGEGGEGLTPSPMGAIAGIPSANKRTRLDSAEEESVEGGGASEGDAVVENGLLLAAGDEGGSPRD